MGEAAPGESEPRHEDEEAPALGAVAVVAGGERGRDALGQRLAHVVLVQDRARDDHDVAAALQMDGGLGLGGNIAARGGLSSKYSCSSIGQVDGSRRR